MYFEYRAFWLPKDIRRREEYEDAYEADPVRGIAAVADGVSSSLFSGSWARLLAETAVGDPPDIRDATRLVAWLNRLRNTWGQAIDVDALAWHQKSKLQQGTFSTLLAVQLYPVGKDDTETTDPFRLFAYSVGDCCLFCVRDDQVRRVFPIEDSRLFQNDPPVIGSVDHQQDHLLQFDTLEDYCQSGDLLVLCSDAIAAWALAQLEAGHSPNWENCWKLSERDWSEHIYTLREENLIRYDDTTVVMLRVAEPPSISDRRDLHADWTDEVKQTFRDLKKQGKKTLEQLKEEGKKTLDWLKPRKRNP